MCTRSSAIAALGATEGKLEDEVRTFLVAFLPERGYIRL
jgi:hypothetical protein